MTSRGPFRPKTFYDSIRDDYSVALALVKAKQMTGKLKKPAGKRNKFPKARTEKPSKIVRNPSCLLEHWKNSFLRKEARSQRTCPGLKI